MVAVAHGKMGQEELGDVMTRMSDGEVQVLVCTTIIEDRHRHRPAMNTLIEVEDADKMGLAQLHRSRAGWGAPTVGRYPMTFRQGKVLTREVASKRPGGHPRVRGIRLRLQDLPPPRTWRSGVRAMCWDLLCRGLLPAIPALAMPGGGGADPSRAGVATAIRLPARYFDKHQLGFLISRITSDRRRS